MAKKTHEQSEAIQDALRRGKKDLAERREFERMTELVWREEVDRHNAAWFSGVAALIPDALLPYIETPMSKEKIDADHFWQRIYITGLAPFEVRVGKPGQYSPFSRIYYLVAGYIGDGWSFNANSSRVDDLAEALAIAEERFIASRARG
jgi:hypothetical protein